MEIVIGLLAVLAVVYYIGYRLQKTEIAAETLAEYEREQKAFAATLKDEDK
jgi:hypothetical protein